MKNEELRGCGFTAEINSTQVEGKIQVEDDRVYLCQNESDGADCNDKLGYRYSWILSNDWSPENRCESTDDVYGLQIKPSTLENITVGNVILDDDGDERTVIFRSGELVVFKNTNNTATGTFTIAEVIRNGWTLKDKEEAITEVTMDDIAKKFGVPVTALKVKK